MPAIHPRTLLDLSSFTHADFERFALAIAGWNANNTRPHPSMGIERPTKRVGLALSSASLRSQLAWQSAVHALGAYPIEIAGIRSSDVSELDDIFHPALDALVWAGSREAGDILATHAYHTPLIYSGPTADLALALGEFAELFASRGNLGHMRIALVGNATGAHQQWEHIAHCFGSTLATFDRGKDQGEEKDLAQLIRGADLVRIGPGAPQVSAEMLKSAAPGVWVITDEAAGEDALDRPGQLWARETTRISRRVLPAACAALIEYVLS